MRFRDLHAQYLALKDEIDVAVRSVIDSTDFILGSPVSELEKQLAESVGRKFCVSCASGSDALTLVLSAWGIGSGDAVFLPDLTFFATAAAVMRVGAFPVLTDVNEETFNMSPDSLRTCIEKTIEDRVLTPRAVIPVDLFGLCAPYPEIEQIASQYGLKVLEDGAQGFGGSISGRRACSFGDASATSFFPAKPLGCYGDGGAVFTDDAELAEKLCSLRAHGRSKFDKYDNVDLGLNSRLDTLQAAILLPKLKAFFEYELDAVNAAALMYNEAFSDILTTPKIPNTYISSYAQYTVLTDAQSTRDALALYLSEKGIPTGVYYPKGLHEQTAVKKYGFLSDTLSVTESVTRRCLSLPIHPYIKDEELSCVIREIIAFFSR